MRRNYPEPPRGGLCHSQPPQFFVNAQTEEQIGTGIQICRQCPVLADCGEWAQRMIAEENRGVNPQHGTRIPIKGVIAGRYYQPTDYQGIPISIRKIEQKISQNREQNDNIGENNA